VSVVGYTDYECPFCARVHEKTRALDARSDVTFVRRHFPLDPACNPAVRRRIHPSACNLARAAICAEAQGRLGRMEDALFGNQRERLPLETLATRVGLDLGRFRACLDAPETERRLAADVAAAMRDGVRSTPSYVVDGAVYSGRFPAERLPPLSPPNGG
jgi:protein-disulfide isomerase